jgi:hypothetical protein
MSDCFATIESPAERLDTMTKESCFIAARIKPQCVALVDRDPSARGQSDEYASLLTVQLNLIFIILALKRQRDPNYPAEEVLAAIDPEVEHIERHVTSVSIEFLEKKHWKALVSMLK